MDANENDERHQDVMQGLFKQHRLKNIVHGEGKNLNHVVLINEQTTRITKQGWMYMSATKRTMLFRKKYFFVFNGAEQCLWYYKNEKNMDCSKGIIKMKKVLKVAKMPNDECALCLIIPDQRWFFLCDTERDRDEWYRCFCSYCLYDDGMFEALEGADNINVQKEYVVVENVDDDDAPIAFACINV